MLVLVLGVAAATLAVPRVADAQSERDGSAQSSRFEAWLDASAARVEQLERPRQQAGMFGVGAQRLGRTFGIAGQLTGTLVRDSAGAGQADLAMQYLLPVWPRLRTDAQLSAASYGVPSADRDRSASVSLRESVEWQVSGARVGLFGVGARSGTSRLDGPTRVDFRALIVGAGVSAASGAVSLSVEWQRALSDDYLLAEATGYGLTRGASSYDYRDMAATAALHLPHVELSGSYARRRSGSATIGRGSGAWGSAQVQLTSQVAAVASTGTFLADVLRGVPQATVTSVGVRVRVGRSHASRAASAPVSDTPAAQRAVTVATDSAGALVTVRVAAAAGAVVQFATSHGEWTPTTMSREGDVFIARVRLPSGTHRIAIRVNDGAWDAPPGTVRVRDDFGGGAGLIVVP